MSSAIQSLEIAKPTGELGALGRLVDVFVAPSETFRDLRSNRSWWLPFLITVLCTYSLSAVAVSRVGLDQLVVNTMKDDPVTADQFAQLPPEQQQSNIAMTETMMKVAMISAPLLVLVYNVGYALLLLVGVNALLGGKADFQALFAMLLYADLIQTIKPIMSIGLLFTASDVSDFSLQNPVATNAAFFLSPGAPGWLTSLAMSMDLVTLWYLALISLGCAVVSRVKLGQSAAIVFGSWLLIVFMRVAWAAVV